MVQSRYIGILLIPVQARGQAVPKTKIEIVLSFLLGFVRQMSKHCILSERGENNEIGMPFRLGETPGKFYGGWSPGLKFSFLAGAISLVNPVLNFDDFEHFGSIWEKKRFWILRKPPPLRKPMGCVSRRLA